MSSSKNNRKDKGKGIRRAENYQLEVPMQLPTHNQFHNSCSISPFSPFTIQINRSETTYKANG